MSILEKFNEEKRLLQQKDSELQLVRDSFRAKEESILHDKLEQSSIVYLNKDETPPGSGDTSNSVNLADLNMQNLIQ